MRWQIGSERSLVSRRYHGHWPRLLESIHLTHCLLHNDLLKKYDNTTSTTSHMILLKITAVSRWKVYIKAQLLLIMTLYMSVWSKISVQTREQSWTDSPKLIEQFVKTLSSVYSTISMMSRAHDTKIHGNVYNSINEKNTQSLSLIVGIYQRFSVAEAESVQRKHKQKQTRWARAQHRLSYTLTHTVWQRRVNIA